MGIIHHNNFAYLKGPKGDRGSIGPAGDRGLKGDKGDRGDRGPQGLAADNSIIRGLISGTAPIIYNEITGEISFDIASYATKEYVDTSVNNSLLLSTDDLVEGNLNLYYTDARTRTALLGGTGVIYNPSTGEIAIGQSVATTDNVIFADIRASGSVQIDGDLIVSGTTVTVNATNLSVSDNLIYLNDGNATANPDLGFAGNYNDGNYAHAGFFRDATDGYWKVFDSYTLEPDASLYLDITHPSFNLAKIQATEFKGLATAAAKLNVARTISGVAFDGTENISLTTDNIAEGTNQYFTNAKARTSISVAGSLNYNPTSGVISYTAPTYSTVATTGSYSDLTNKPVYSTVATTGSYSDLTNKPTLATIATTGNYSDLTNKPVYSTVATTGSYVDLTNKPTLATVATTGSYSDLTNKPFIPAYLTDLSIVDGSNGQVLGTNGAGQFTFVSIEPSIPVNGTIQGEEIVFGDNPSIGGTYLNTLHPVATSGNYNALNNLPSIPSAVSQLANDSGYITSVSWTQVAGKPVFADVATTGSYTDLANKPFIPSDLNQLTDLTGIIANLRPGSWNDLTDKPEVISLTDLKTIVAASNDFADFKTRIANL